MNKVFWIILLFITGISFAVDYEVDSSSNPVNASTTIWIPNTRPGDILGKILVNQRAASAETIKVYDSSGTATGLLGTIDLSTGASTMGGPFQESVYSYGYRLSSGVTITKSASLADLTILWKHVR